MIFVFVLCCKVSQDAGHRCSNHGGAASKEGGVATGNGCTMDAGDLCFLTPREAINEGIAVLGVVGKLPLGEDDSDGTR